VEKRNIYRSNEKTNVEVKTLNIIQPLVLQPMYQSIFQTTSRL